MGMERHVKVFRNGRNRAVRIPVEFDFPGDEVIMHKEGDRIIIEPVKASEGLREWLSKQEPIDDEFPDVDEALLPARDVDL
ncbi:antitoxin [Rhizobium sp. PAMB 3182]